MKAVLTTLLCSCLCALGQNVTNQFYSQPQSAGMVISTVPSAGVVSGCNNTFAIYPNGATRNNFPGQVGVIFTVGLTNMVVCSLSRSNIMDTTSNPHLVAIYAVSYSGVGDIYNVISTLASNTVPAVGAHQVASTPLDSPVTLVSGSTYALVSLEETGGDLWYDQRSISIGNTTNIFDAYSTVFPTVTVLIGSADEIFGQPNFNFQ